MGADVRHQTAISSLYELVKEISIAMHDQSNGLQVINDSAKDLDRVTQQNVAMFEETSAATQSLTAQTDHLSDLTSGFLTSSADVPFQEPYALRSLA